MYDEYPDILTVKEVMYLLGFGKNKIYAMLNDGTIKGVRMGRSWRISKQSLIKLLDS